MSLSPLIFLLVAKGMSRLLKEASKMETSKGSALVLLAVSHIFFSWMIS